MKNKHQTRDENLIEKVHKVQLQTLVVFDQLCEKLNLKYTLSSGTLLGAVRHKGFIPWDDDIDVSMLREDYEKLIKCANDNLPEGYFLQHYTNEKYHNCVFAKIRNSNTTFIESVARKLKVNHGLAIDIFPIDRVKDEKERAKYQRKTELISRLKISYSMPYVMSLNKFYKRFFGVLLFPIARMIGLKRLNQKQDKLDKSHNQGEFTTGDIIMKKKLMPYSIFENLEKIEFEGKMFWAIKDRDLYLKTVYGDYMQLPPEEKRRVHLAEIIDCENSYLNYVGKKQKQRKGK